MNPHDAVKYFESAGRTKERGNVLADKENVDGAEIELVEIRQSCNTVPTRVHARIELTIHEPTSRQRIWEGL